MNGRFRLAAPALLAAFALAIVFAPLAVADPSGSFLPKVDYPTGGHSWAVVAADLNKDGKLDLATANRYVNTASVLLGNGDGTFQPHQDFGVGNDPYDLAVGDVNNDGNLDLVAANFEGSTVSVLLGNGNGSFQPQNEVLAPDPLSVEVVDLNGDGNLDLVTADYFWGAVSILLGNGNGTFRPSTEYATNGAPFSVDVGDVNGDGKPDVVASNRYGDTVSVLLGNGDGTVQPSRNYPTGAGPFAVTIGDLNGDGKPDLATGNFYANSVSVLLGNGDGSFLAKQDYPMGDRPVPVEIVDVTGDGKPDLVGANDGGGSVAIFPGNGDGTLQARHEYPTGAQPIGMVVADLNGDGWPDITVSNFVDQDVSVLLAPDIEAPTAAPTVSPPPGGSGWNTSSLTVEWNWADNPGGSGIDLGNCIGSTSVTAEGVTHLTETCPDIAGNLGTASITVRIDKTAPDVVVSATAGGDSYVAGTWTKHDVVIHLSCTDTVSGLGATDPDMTVSSEGPDQSVDGDCGDVAGNVVHPVFSDIHIDKSGPALAPTVTPSVIAFRGTATAAPHASDLLSDVASADCQKPDTSTPGVKTLTCTATDNVGNTSTVTVSYRVAKPLASTRTLNCNGYYSGRSGNVTVPSGATCVLIPGTRATNNVMVQRGGTLRVDGVKIGGTLSIAGNATVCGSRIALDVVASTGSLALGGPGCAGNWIGAHVYATNSAKAVSIWNNTIEGGLTVKKLRGTTSIVGNQVFGDLLVAQSGPPVEVSGNKAINARCVRTSGMTGSGNTARLTNTCPR